MDFDADAAEIRSFWDAYRGRGRRLQLATAERMIDVNIGFDAFECPPDGSCSIADIRATVGDLRPHETLQPKFGYEQLEGTATWPATARHVLAAAAIGRGEDVLHLALHYAPTKDHKYCVLRLVRVERPHLLVDCVVQKPSETLDEALKRLVEPLFGEAYSGCRVAVVESTRLVRPLAHSLRQRRSPVEYVIRANGDDDGPMAQTHMAGDRRDGIRRTMAEITAGSSREFVPTYCVGASAGRELVTEAESSHLLIKPRISGTATNTGAEREQRARELREIAVVAATGDYSGDVRPITNFNSRQSPLPMENLILMRALIAGAAVWARR